MLSVKFTSSRLRLLFSIQSEYKDPGHPANAVSSTAGVPVCCSLTAQHHRDAADRIGIVYLHCQRALLSILNKHNACDSTLV